MVAVRLYYQIYWDDRERTRFNAKELASIIKVLAWVMEEFSVHGHQLRLKLKDDVEVKIGFDPFIQVSSPSLEFTQSTWERIKTTLDSLSTIQEG